MLPFLLEILLMVKYMDDVTVKSLKSWHFYFKSCSNIPL